MSQLDLGIGGNELVGLIGPNGAGKTTVFNLITGVYRRRAGDIRFDGAIRRGPPAPIASLPAASPARFRISGFSAR